MYAATFHFFEINTLKEVTKLCLVLFNLYDKDGNGVLDAEELKQLQQSYCKASKAAFMVGFR
jgi:Ca2+-binding EF-hand superfamily protein